MPHLNIDNLRREAHQLKKLKGIQHAKALDQVAVAYGYSKWTDLIAEQNGEERAEKRRGARTPMSLRHARRERFGDDQPPEGAHQSPYENPSLVKRIFRP